MANFDDIRPYNDDEVKPTLAKLLKDAEFLHAISSLKFPEFTQRHPQFMARLASLFLRWETRNVQNVHDVQMVAYSYLEKNINTTMNGLTVSGLDKLSRPGPYLFVSNHRDIAMDPACVNWLIYHNGFSTLRIAIGDNLLSKPYVSDIMRLNKTFVVNRSATSPREKLKAAKHLSAYIHHSIAEEKANIWIAQREGRAKDGRDITNRAIISMFGLNKSKTQSFGDYIAELNIVPVAISYEWDPCDTAKAQEIYAIQTVGEYAKQEHEDVASIAKGIRGQKGRVHVAFGDVLGDGFNDAEAVALEIERQIQSNYVLHASNLAAYQMLYQQAPQNITFGVDGNSFDPNQHQSIITELNQRMAAIPEEQRTILLSGYANPVLSKLAHMDAGALTAASSGT